MSTAKENPCRKFQANFFNKSKCQNCFKPRELHLLTDQDLTQAKPIYGGWLCLAPEGTDFDNPMQRSRKWQRRFFVLYEHGCLRFALDESPSTLPQGTVNMNLCTDVVDAEPLTGQKNSLCIITPEQEYFIRGENKEIINGWSEQLIVYPRTNKQNQKKKRKVEPATFQEPGPAKVAVTDSGIPDAETVPDSSSIIWQEELSQREADAAAAWSQADLPGSSPPPAGDRNSAAQASDGSSVNGDKVDRGSLVLHASAPQPPNDLLSPTGSCSSLGGIPRCLSPAPSDPFPSGSSLLSNGSHISGSVSSLDSDASGGTVNSTDSHPPNQRGSHSYSHHDTPRSRRLEAEARKAEKRSRFRSPDRQEREAILSPERSRSGVIEKMEALELENQEKMEVEESGRSGARQGRSEHRRFHREGQTRDAGEDLDFASSLPPLRRAKSLDRRTTESVMTPDLLNFKKGWMVKLDEQAQWKKYWFVLTDHSLRYYKDSIAEEASDLDGEIDLSTCSNVTEYQAQRNYGFQIHTLEGVHTLSAMTAGIRRNWMQAIMKNVRPSNAPDVASSSEDHGFSPLEGLVRPDVTQDSPSSETSSVERESVPGVIKSRARERRREGRSKTFDWAEFRPIAQALAQQRAQEAENLHADLGEPERSRRREERRRRYETVSGSSAETIAAQEGAKTDYECEVGFEQTHSISPTNFEKQQRVEEVIEQHWQQVEKTPIREERRVPLPPVAQSKESSELEQLLEHYKQGIEDLKAQLENCHQQLLDSNKHKQELELQLRTALEREQDIRSGYISPLEHALGLEADVTPQTKRPELVSSQAQSLTKKYQETKELLKLQELKKRNMQAQLGLSLSHLKESYFSDPQTCSILECPPHELVQKTVRFLLQDTTEAIQELEDLVTEKPVTLKELANFLRSHSFNKEMAEKQHIQKLLANWKYQQELENETLKKSLARAGESIREYESRLLTMEDMVEKVQKQNTENLKSPYGPLLQIEKHSDAGDVTIGMLSQRAELLTSENEALKQRCQEIVNQLTEADREIDRLKVELNGQQGGKQYHQDMEELKRLKEELAENEAIAIDREYYERELNEKSLRLHEALVTLEELGNTLKDTEKKLQLKEATLKGLGFQADYEEEELHPEKEQLKELLEASQVNLTEMEAKLQHTQQQCCEFEARNIELITLSQESEREYREKLREAENEIRMLQEKLEFKTFSKSVEAGEEQVIDKGLMKQVVDKIAIKSEAINQVLEMLAMIDTNVAKMLTGFKYCLLGSSDEEGVFISQNDRTLLIEGEFWSQLLGTNKKPLEEDGHRFERHVAEQMMAQTRLMLLMRSPCPQVESEAVMKSNLATMYGWLDNEAHALIHKELVETLKAKSNVLKQIASNVEAVKDEELLASFVASFDFDQERKCLPESLSDALMEACISYAITRMKVQHEKQLKQVQEEAQSARMDCPNCVKLREAMGVLQNQLSEVVLNSPTGSQSQVADIIAKHIKELQEVKGGYEQEAQKLKQEITKAKEEIRASTEENVKEINSLTLSMEKLKKKHELERTNLIEKFDQEMEELRGMVSPTDAEQYLTEKHRTSHHSAAQTSSLKERIQDLVNQVSVMAEEMRRREEQGDITTVRLKYEKDLENLKVEVLLVLAVIHL